MRCDAWQAPWSVRRGEAAGGPAGGGNGHSNEGAMKMLDDHYKVNDYIGFELGNILQKLTQLWKY